MFYDPAQFDFVPVLEAGWEKMHAEYLTVRRELDAWPEKSLYEADAWGVFGLYDFPGGRPMRNRGRCPFTASLIADAMPTHGTGGFSVLRPGARVKPHRGYPGAFLRLHLGLDVPAGDCGLRVAGEVRGWEQGRVLVFDDRVTHSAWNLADRDRVVLLVDFVPSAPARPLP